MKWRITAGIRPGLAVTVPWVRAARGNTRRENPNERQARKEEPAAPSDAERRIPALPNSRAEVERLLLRATRRVPRSPRNTRELAPNRSAEEFPAITSSRRMVPSDFELDRTIPMPH